MFHQWSNGQIGQLKIISIKWEYLKLHNCLLIIAVDNCYCLIRLSFFVHEQINFRKNFCLQIIIIKLG